MLGGEQVTGCPRVQLSLLSLPDWPLADVRLPSCLLSVELRQVWPHRMQDCYGGCVDAEQAYYGMMDEVGDRKAVAVGSECHVDHCCALVEVS